MYTKVFKRAIDVLLSFFGIIVLCIPMFFVAIVIKIDSPGPIFFKQKRVGIHKTYFDIIKFRSMPVHIPKDMPTHLFKAENMLSKWQKFIRKTSIDELPQLFNIFIGNMTIIGPRPALWNQYDLIAERDKYGANDVKPGLTGLAQISGRDELEIEVKARLDGEYVKKMSFWFDAKMFICSVFYVLKRDGVVEGGTGSVDGKKEKVETK